MTPINNPHSNNLPSDRPDIAAYDINRFNKTPQARHYARRAAKQSALRSDDAELSQLVADAKGKTTQSGPAFPEYKSQSPAEIIAIINRVNQTAKLIDWMRTQEMEMR